MIKKILFFMLISLCLQIRVESQKWGSITGEGEVVRQELKLDPIHGVNLGISGSLVLTQGSPQQITIEGQQNIIDNIKKVVKDGYWSIEFDKNVRDAKEIKITMTVPNLDELSLCGSGSITTTNTFKGASDFEINVSGSGHLKMGLEAKSTELNLSRSGEVTLNGLTKDFEINISGSGDIVAKDFKSTACEVSISGSGDASVNVDGDLETSISGSGDVTYTGNTSVHASISGSGTVSKMK